MLRLSLGVGVGVRERDLRGQNDARGEGKTSDELGRGTIKGDGGGRMVREGASTTSANANGRHKLRHSSTGHQSVFVLEAEEGAVGGPRLKPRTAGYSLPRPTIHSSQHTRL
jgi:hypothetical protein